MPGGGHPPVFQARGKPYPPIQLSIRTVTRVRKVPIRMRVGQRTTGRVIISGLGDFESKAVLSINGLSESRASRGYVTLVLLIRLADYLELGQYPGPYL